MMQRAALTKLALAKNYSAKGLSVPFSQPFRCISSGRDRKRTPREARLARLQNELAKSDARGSVSPVLRQLVANTGKAQHITSAPEVPIVVATLSMLGKTDLSIEVLARNKRLLTVESLNQALRKFPQAGDAKIALAALDIAQQAQLQPDTITYTRAIMACAVGLKHEIPIAYEIFNQMLTNRIDPTAETYGAVLLAYSREGRAWSEAENLLERISRGSGEVRAEIFASAIISCANNHQHSYAVRLFEAAIDEGLFPGMNACVAAAKAASKSSNVDLLDTICAMIESRGEPKLAEFNAIMSAYGNLSDTEGAKRVFRKMVGRSITPDVATLNGMLLSYLRSRQTEIAFELANELLAQGIKWNVHTVNILLEVCANNRNAEMAERLVAEAENLLIQLDRTSFENMMHVYMATKEYEKVIQLWRGNSVCRRQARSAKTLSFLLQACRELADATTAEELMEEFIQRRQMISLQAENHLLSTFLAAGKEDQAIAYLQKMLQNTHSPPNVFSFTCVMNYFIEKTKFEEALDVFDLYHQSKSSKGHDDAIYVLAARASLESSTPKRAQAICTECDQARPLEVRKELAQIAIAACDKMDDWRNAVLIYDSIHKQIESDKDCNLAMYTMVVRLVARLGASEDSLEINGGEWYRTTRIDQGWF